MNDKKLPLDAPIIMGIVNATPDSFYDGGQAFNHDFLSEQIADFNLLGVQMIDVGAESSRPGSTPISSDEEIERLSRILPKIILETDAIISVDTTKPAVAKYALSEGAHYINDISGGESDALLTIVAEHKAGIILMHKQGLPESMQQNPQYRDVVHEVKHYLDQQINRVSGYGIESIIVDPGIGFGKTLDHNILLLKHIDQFLSLNVPILIGTSNKSFIDHLTEATIDQRVPGSIASVIATYQKGAHIFRVHNVKETIQALDVFRAINE